MFQVSEDQQTSKAFSTAVATNLRCETSDLKPSKFTIQSFILTRVVRDLTSVVSDLTNVVRDLTRDLLDFFQNETLLFIL